MIREEGEAQQECNYRCTKWERDKAREREWLAISCFYFFLAMPF